MAKKREKESADKVMFNVAGIEMNRYQMMEYIVRMTYEGKSIPEILLGNDVHGEVLPIASEVMEWLEIHPDFANAMLRADKYRGELMAHEGLSIIRETKDIKVNGSIDKNQIAYAKLANESLIQAASFLNEKFQTKTQVKQQTTVQDLSEQQVKDRLAALLENPEVRAALMGMVDVPVLSDAIEVEQ